MAKAKGKADSSGLPPTLLPPGQDIGRTETVRYLITGITPLLQQSAVVALASAPEGMSAGKKDHLSGAEEAESGTYQTADGNYYHPGAAFRDAAIEAVTGMKLGKKAAGPTFTSAFFNITEQAVLIDPKTRKPLKGYTVDTRNVVNPNTGGMIPRSRPLWPEWACIVEFEYDPDLLNETLITQALNLAGARVGVGQLRPRPKQKNPKKGKGGRYGKFRAELLK